MVTPDQLAMIAEYVRDFLYDSFERCDEPWVSEFPRAADHRWQHTLNVYSNAEKILVGEGVEDDRADVVRVAVLLHDVSMFICDHSVHGQVSAGMAEKYLTGQGVDEDFIRRVSRAVAEHGTDLGDLPPDEQGLLFSWEGKVLLEADILDKLGASAVTSALLYLGKSDQLNFEARKALLESPAYQRAEFFKDYVWTNTGRKMAERRFSFFLKFLDQLQEEVSTGSMPAFSRQIHARDHREGH